MEQQRRCRGLAIAALAALAPAAFEGCGQATVTGPGDQVEQIEQAAEPSVSTAQSCVSVARPGAAPAVVFDAQIYNSAAGAVTNFGAVPTMVAGTVGAAQREALIQLDLSAIPAGPSTSITGATLSLTQSSTGKTGPETINVHRVTSPWSEGTVTWQSFAGGFDPAVWSTFTNAAASPSVDVTALVAAWTRGTYQNLGLLLESPVNATSYWSSDYGVTAARPTLSVCFTVTCAPGFADCNGSALDGCETDVAGSALSCGGCGVACESGVCAGGVCQAPSCTDGIKNGDETGVDCGGACAKPEICNGVDDDCNGLVDDGLGSTTCGLGACQVTVQNCVNGQPQSCVPLPPHPEVCDGVVDDDCDGVVDNGCACTDGQTQSCYTAAPATLGVGLCHPGVQTCAQGQWGACLGEVTPAAEVCNGLDDDCNGQIDEGGVCLPPCNISVLLLGDGGAGGQTFAAQLGAAGFAVHYVSTGSTTYAGSPAASGYGSVVILAGLTHATDLPAAGQTSILNAAQGGSTTGVVLTEWAAYHRTINQWVTLDPLVLLARTTGATSKLTFTLQQAGHPLWGSLPATWTTVSTMGANVGATLVHGGVQLASCAACQGPGVAVRDNGKGRVVHHANAGNYNAVNAFAGDASFAAMMLNSVRWSARCL